MKFSKSLLATLLAISCTPGIYSSKEPMVVPSDLPIKEMMSDIMDTVNDPKYISRLSLEDRLILGVFRLLVVEAMFNPEALGVQVHENHLTQIKSAMMDGFIAKLEKTPSNEYLIEKVFVSITAIIISGVVALVALLLVPIASLGCFMGFASLHKVGVFFAVFFIVSLVLMLQMRMKFHRLKDRLGTVTKEFMQELSEKAAQQRIVM